MPNYQNSKIYKIISPSNPDLIYYGATTQNLSMRMAGHRRNTSASKEILCYEDAIILLVENYPCNSKEELFKKEGEYILNNNCVNKHVAGRNRKQHYEDNKEILKEQRKKNYENNKDKEKEYQKEYYELNKEILKEQRKKNYEDNKEKIKEYHKKYYELNKDNVKEQQKKYYEDNKKKF